MARQRVAPGFWWDADEEVGYIDFRVQGRESYRVQRIVRGVTYREALREYGRVKEEAGRRKRNPRDIPTLRRYVDEFSRLRPLRPSTEKPHAYMLARWILPELGELPLHKITSARLMEFRTKLLLEKKSPSTANRHISLVRKLLNEARIRGLIETHPAPGGTVPPLPETPPLAAYLSEGEREAFLTVFINEIAFRKHIQEQRKLGPVKKGRGAPAKRRYGGGRRGDSEATGEAFRRFAAARPLFLCALDTGLTLGDLINLRWHQVDLQNEMISIRRAKTAVPVNIPMTARLVQELRRLPRAKDVDLVFRTATGEPWTNIRVQRSFNLAKTLAGITRPFRFHDMRHDFASALAREGVSLYVIAQLLGHTSMRMTMRYAHLHPDNLRAAIAALPGREDSDQTRQSDVDGNVDAQDSGRPGSRHVSMPSIGSRTKA